jgi:hypothetical protein
MNDLFTTEDLWPIMAAVLAIALVLIIGLTWLGWI